VSAKSMVTPSSIRRLSAGRKSLTPLMFMVASPAFGPLSTENSEL
jgi:hypothetical protein